MDTECNKCCFFNNESCDFNIPNIISDKVKKIEDGYVLTDFKCPYGFGKQAYEDNKYLMSFEDLKSSMLSKNQMLYVLYIDKPEYQFDLKQACDYIEGIEYKPCAICIVSYKQVPKDILDEFQSKCDIPWRVVFPHVQSTKYETLIGAFNNYLQFNPDLFVIDDFYENYQELINAVHETHVIRQKDDIICLNEDLKNIYIPKECFFNNEHDWQQLFNTPQEYLASTDDKYIL
tara:strand:- start:35 stop:730 length:696 start_codon:yes stop_codon:yes gene_type:complete